MQTRHDQRLRQTSTQLVPCVDWAWEYLDLCQPLDAARSEHERQTSLCGDPNGLDWKTSAASSAFGAFSTADRWLRTTSVLAVPPHHCPRNAASTAAAGLSEEAIHTHALPVHRGVAVLDESEIFNMYNEVQSIRQGRVPDPPLKRS